MADRFRTEATLVLSHLATEPRDGPLRVIFFEDQIYCYYKIHANHAGSDNNDVASIVDEENCELTWTGGL